MIDAFAALACQPDLSNEQLNEALKGEPSLNTVVLDLLAAQAERLAPRAPRAGWSLMRVADLAAMQTQDEALQALAALHLARAANNWARPLYARDAAKRAEELFTQMGEAAWAAAARWQQNALPWTRPDFSRAAAILEKALAEMSAVGLLHLLPDCRLSLAYARLLTGNFVGAESLTAESERTFAARADSFGRCRSLLTWSSVLRRFGDFQRAANILHEAATLATEIDAPVYLGQANLQLGYLDFVVGGQYESADAHWRSAANLFAQADLPLWVAQCRAAQAEIHFYRGEFADMGRALAEARDSFVENQALGPLADNLLGSARWETARGNHHAAIALLEQSRALYERMGAHWMAAVVHLNQGQVYGQLGRYQRALRELEQAQEYFEGAGMWQRLAETEWDLARFWLYLGQPRETLRYLDRVCSRHQEAEAATAPFNTLNLRAAALMALGSTEAAQTCLRESLRQAEELGTRPQTALACRLLAELLIAQGHYAEVERLLHQAESLFAGTELLQEQALIRLAWAAYYERVGDLSAATSARQQALALSEGLFPEIAWQAHAGLAQFATSDQEALHHFGRAAAEIRQIRRRFRQPELTASFLEDRSELLDKAVTLAANAGFGLDVVTFTVESKALILISSLISTGRPAHEQSHPSPDTEALRNLHAEIGLLQDQMRVTMSGRPRIIRSADEVDLRRRLAGKTRQYARLRSRVERQRPSDDGLDALLPTSFKPTTFVGVMDSLHAGRPWLALDYYLTKGEVFVVALGGPSTGNEVLIERAQRTPRIEVALRQVSRAAASVHVHQGDVDQLSAWLFPRQVVAALTQDTALYIAPHRELHHLPWSALSFGETGEPLISHCTPVIVPSLHGLQLLGERGEAAAAPAAQGLALMLSEFQGRRSALPAVRHEAAEMRALMGPAMSFLEDHEATTDALRLLARPDGLARKYAFLHVASHAFHDPLTGWLSGIALYDGDMQLDDLWVLAPVPSLVVLSACSGMRSRVYGGDEHVSLANTCLASGARAVVGSLWPVRDDAAAPLMRDFYRRYRAGSPAADALVHAQRCAITRGEPAYRWGGFTCTGGPVGHLQPH